jgi:hypothetical protein
MASRLRAAYLRPMADYTLKLYRRSDPHDSPGQLIGKYAFSADGSAEAVEHATTTFAGALRNCDYALIGGMHGRVVWEKGRNA